MININKNSDYVIIASLFSDKNIEISIAYRGENTSDNLFILNEFCYSKKNMQIFKDLFSVFQYEDKPKEFADFFVDNNKFYAVFKYTESENIIQKYRKGFNFSHFDERSAILESILIRIDKLNKFPNEILACLTEPKNIQVDEQKNIHFIYNFQNVYKYKGCDFAKIFKNLHGIIYALLESEATATFNKALHIVLDKCKNGVYVSIPELAIELKKAEKICKTTTWFSYFKYQLSLRKPLLDKIIKTSVMGAIVAGIIYLVYSKLSEGQADGSAAKLVSIGDVTYNGNTEDESDKNVSTENINNQSGETTTGEITLSEGLDMEYEDYIVQYGDTVASICSDYYKDAKYVTAVTTFNGIKPEEKLTAGTILKLPNRTAIALYVSR